MNEIRVNTGAFSQEAKAALPAVVLAQDDHLEAQAALFPAGLAA